MDYNYESDHTKFMREYLEKNPEVKEKRTEARNMCCLLYTSRCV